LAGYNYRIEPQDINMFDGKTMTFSFYAKADAATSLTFSVSGDSVMVSSVVIPLTTSWQRFTQTFTYSSTTSASFVDLTLRADGTILTSHYLTGVQLEIGDTATPFEHRSYGDELQRCQRYFNRYKTEGGFALIVPSINGGTTNARCALALSTKLRTTPTITSSSSDAILIRNNGSFTTYASTAIGLGSEQQIEPNFVALSVSVASGLTSASVNIPYINSNGYIDCDAEL